MKDPPILAAGALLDGKFRVVRALGTGGMGAVYEVENERLKKRCALKLLHAHQGASPEGIDRFRREMTADGHIRNAHVVETYDEGVLDTGEPYVVMELLVGETLASLIERKGRLDLAEICELVGQACDGAQAAHEAGILHRDLKPANLFVTLRDGRPFVKLLDFGISRFDIGAGEETRLTSDGAILGTPCYMSPDQIRGKADLDARSDVYALGVILYECATGKVPFRAETLPLLGVLICGGEHERLGTLRPELPGAFRDLVAQAMAVDRAHRTPTARRLGEELRAIGARLASGLSAEVLPESPPLDEDERSGADGMRSTARIEPVGLAPLGPYARVHAPPSAVRAPRATVHGPHSDHRLVWAVVAAVLVGAAFATALRAGLGDAHSGSVLAASSAGQDTGDAAPAGSTTSSTGTTSSTSATSSTSTTSTSGSTSKPKPEPTPAHDAGLNTVVE